MEGRRVEQRTVAATRRSSGMSARAVISVLVTLSLAIASSALGGPGRSVSTSGPAPRTVRAVSPHRDVTLYWQVHSGAVDVRLRLYRIDHELAPVLLAEQTAGPGSSTFHFVDADRPAQPTTYEIRYVARADSEVTLGSVVCLPGSLEPDRAAPHSFSIDPVAMPLLAALPGPAAARLPTRSVVHRSGYIGGPDPPVPRSM